MTKRVHFNDFQNALTTVRSGVISRSWPCESDTRSSPAAFLRFSAMLGELAIVRPRSEID